MAFKHLAALLFFIVLTTPQVSMAQHPTVLNENRVADLQTKLGTDPNNPDLMRQLAAAQAAASQYEEALTTIDRAKTLAPADNDIALARARILLWSGRLSEAQAEAEIVRVRARDYPELAEVETAIRAASAERRIRSGIAIAAGIAGVDLAGSPNQGWKSLSLSGFTVIKELNVFTASVEHEARQTSDTRLSFSASRGGPSYEIRLGASFTPNADFREDWGVQAGAEYRMHPNAALITDVRYAKYSNLSVVSVIPGFRLQTTDTAHSLTLRLISIFRTDGDNRMGVSTRYDGELGDGFRIFGGAASYPDTEAGVTRQMRSAFAGAAFPLSERVSLNITGEYDRRAKSYTRKALLLSLNFRFDD